MNTVTTNIATALLLLSVFFAPLLSFAHEPIVTLDKIGGVELIPGNNILVVPYFPYPQPLEGTVTHEGFGNLKPVELTASVNYELIYGPQTFRDYRNQSLYEYFIPWDVPAPGNYFISVLATHDEPGQREGCKAAPALASDYLRGIADMNGQAIKAVAKETGWGGEVWAKEKCAPDYYEKTILLIVP